MWAVAILIAVAALAVALDRPLPPVEGQARVSDGDSFHLGDERIRLLGIDAPELAQQCDTETGEKWACGRAARNRMADLLSAGPVDCHPEDHDQYDRLLAICRVNGSDIAATMVAEGLAISSGGYWNEEAAARRDRLGIWAGSFDTPRNWRDDQARPQGLFGWFDLF